MSYFPSQDNPNVPSGIVFFGNPATDDKFEASSNFTYNSSSNSLLVGNVVVANSGYVGSVSSPSAINILSDGDVNFSSDVVIGGNLTVQGSQTILNTETLAIEDNIIILNRNVTGIPTLDAGIEVERGDSVNVKLYYDEGTDQWKFTNDGTTHYAIPTGVPQVSFSLTGDSGTSQSIGNSDTLTIAGGSGISTVAGATDTVTVHLNVDNSTIEINSDAVRVKDGGISSDKLASGAVTESKITRSIDSTFSNNDTIGSDINLVSGGAGGITVKLPAPASGKLVVVKKVDSGAGPVTVARNSSETIDGATSKALYYQYESMTFVSDGTNWYII